MRHLARWGRSWPPAANASDFRTQANLVPLEGREGPQVLAKGLQRGILNVASFSHSLTAFMSSVMMSFHCWAASGFAFISSCQRCRDPCAACLRDERQFARHVVLPGPREASDAPPTSLGAPGDSFESTVLGPGQPHARNSVIRAASSSQDTPRDTFR